MVLWTTISSVGDAVLDIINLCLTAGGLASSLTMCSTVTMVYTWWRHQMETCSALLVLCAGNSPVPVNSPHKGQWCGALMLSLICAWINDWVNNGEAGDLRPHRGLNDVNIMRWIISRIIRFTFSDNNQFKIERGMGVVNWLISLLLRYRLIIGRKPLVMALYVPMWQLVKLSLTCTPCDTVYVRLGIVYMVDVDCSVDV